MAALGRFSVHHIGGRNGVRVFPICPPFEAEFVSVFYDADPDCLPQIEKRNAGLPSELHVLPHCLWSARETRELTIAVDGYASSLYPFNPTYADRTDFARDHDYRFGDAIRPARKVAVETTTLDAVLAAPGAPEAPDFLSIDVQGAELEILKGARRTVDESVLALQLEVEFIDLYAGQPLFSDIFRHLDAAGFEFLRFTSIGRAYGRPAPIGLRSETCDISADALFVKRPSARMTEAGFAKLALIGVVFGHFDLVGACLDRLPSNWLGDAQASGAGRRIARFLGELDATRRATAGYRPWGFSDRWPASDGRPRFAVGAAFDAAAARLAERRKTEDARLRAALPELRKLGSDEPYGIEPVLIAHGFEQQAGGLKARRISEIATLLAAVGESKVF